MNKSNIYFGFRCSLFKESEEVLPWMKNEILELNPLYLIYPLLHLLYIYIYIYINIYNPTNIILFARISELLFMFRLLCDRMLYFLRSYTSHHCLHVKIYEEIKSTWREDDELKLLKEKSDISSEKKIAFALWLMLNLPLDWFQIREDVERYFQVKGTSRDVMVNKLDHQTVACLGILFSLDSSWFCI